MSSTDQRPLNGSCHAWPAALLPLLLVPGRHGSGFGSYRPGVAELWRGAVAARPTPTGDTANRAVGAGQSSFCNEMSGGRTRNLDGARRALRGPKRCSLHTKSRAHDRSAVGRSEPLPSHALRPPGWPTLWPPGGKTKAGSVQPTALLWPAPKGPLKSPLKASP